MLIREHSLFKGTNVGADGAFGCRGPMPPTNIFNKLNFIFTFIRFLIAPNLNMLRPPIKERNVDFTSCFLLLILYFLFI